MNLSVGIQFKNYIKAKTTRWYVSLTTHLFFIIIHWYGSSYRAWSRATHDEENFVIYPFVEWGTQIRLTCLLLIRIFPSKFSSEFFGAVHVKRGCLQPFLGIQDLSPIPPKPLKYTDTYCDLRTPETNWACNSKMIAFLQRRIKMSKGSASTRHGNNCEGVHHYSINSYISHTLSNHEKSKQRVQGPGYAERHAFSQYTNAHADGKVLIASSSWITQHEPSPGQARFPMHFRLRV